MRARHHTTHRPPSTAPRVRAGGFTLVEMMMVTSVATLMVAAFLGFIVTSARLTQGVTKQGVMNQQAGNGIETIIKRIRVANTITVDAAGEVLTLTFDDNPAVDSDGDGNAFDDNDHTEIFQFRYAPGAKQPLVGTNYIDWINGSTLTTKTLCANVRQLPNLDVFALTNNDATVIINFGLIDPYANDRYQNIEIRTQATRRNHR